MRIRFDSFAKAATQRLLKPLGEVRTQEEIPSSVQYIDALFEPKILTASIATERAKLGLLGRLAEEFCMFEFFHNPPGWGDIEDCIAKQHQLSGQRAREARSAKQPRSPLPRLWVLSGGVPETAIEYYDIRPMDSKDGWPPGCLVVGKAMSANLLVLPHLPERRDTLCLRLMGAGRTLIQAIRELAALPDDAWEREALVPYLLAFRLDPQSHFNSDESEEDAMSYAEELQAIYDDWEAKTRAAGHKQGRSELLIKLLSLKFGPLDAATVARVEAASDTKLDRWAEQVLTASTLAAVFSEP